VASRKVSGARTLRAPRLVVARQAASASSTQRAISANAIAMYADVLGDLALGLERCGQQEANLSCTSR
jgi:hypothetical protein